MLSVPMTSVQAIRGTKCIKMMSHKAPRSGRLVAVCSGQSVSRRKGRPRQGEILFFFSLALLRGLLPIISVTGFGIFGGIAKFFPGDPVVLERAWKVAATKYSRDSAVSAPGLYDDLVTVAPATVDSDD